VRLQVIEMLIWNHFTSFEKPRSVASKRMLLEIKN
jgi:hypothetical protein